jgi:hypothetical protein
MTEKADILETPMSGVLESPREPDTTENRLRLVGVSRSWQRRRAVLASDRPQSGFWLASRRAAKTVMPAEFMPG